MKVLIIGSARHGKDTLAKVLWTCHGATYAGSSEVANKEFIFKELAPKYGYKTHEECFEDRKQHREEWYDLICAYNTPDKSRLAKAILKDHTIYVGMRDIEEFNASRHLFDLVIGVFNPDLPIEDKSSFNIDIFSVSDLVVIQKRGDMFYEEYYNTMTKKVLTYNGFIFAKF